MGDIDANVLIGREAGQYLKHTDTTQNVAIGKQALRGANADSTAPINSVAIGYTSLAAVTTGTSNTVVGAVAGTSVTTAVGAVLVPVEL